MKKNNYLSLSFIIFIILVVFIKSSYINKIIVDTSYTFIKNVFPSLFIMLVLSSLLVELNFYSLITKIIKKITKKDINSYSLFIFFISIFTGSPTNAKIINGLLDNKSISVSSANKILKFSFFMNPLFIINTIGILLNDKVLSIFIFISCFLGNVFLFFIYRDKSYVKEKIVYEKNSITKILFNSINSAITTILSIYGVICFFSCISSVISCFLGTNSVFISGILEVTSGVVLISSSNISIIIKCFLITFFISFGGFSLHAQTMNILENKSIDYKSFFKARVLHAFISSFINILFNIFYIG